MLPSTQSKISAFGYLVVAGGCLSLLGACSGEPTEQSSESFSAMADVHNDPSVIESTAEIDKLLLSKIPTVTGRPVSSSLIRYCSIVPVV